MDEKNVETSTKINLLYAENYVVFLFCDCSLDKKFLFHELSKDEAKLLLERFQYIEKLTWRQFANMPREKGLTPEIEGTESFQLIHDQNSSDLKLVEQHYFHFRITGKFRVFGYQREQFFCITHFDVKGKLHHD